MGDGWENEPSQIGNGWDSKPSTSENSLTENQKFIATDVQELWKKAEENKQSVWNFLLGNLENKNLTEVFKGDGGYIKMIKAMKGKKYRIFNPA